MELKNKQGHHKVAIVGTGSLFPGAFNTKDFWLNILAEKDFIKDVPDTHWLKEDYYDPNDKKGDKVYCKKGAFLDDISFDPVEFGMPPNLLTSTDTLQLLSLIVARDTLADTVSYQSGKVNPKKTSVILGVAGGTELIGQMSARIHTPEWVSSMRKQGLPESKINAILSDVDKCYSKWTENTFPGLLGNVVSGRIANRFDLNGTNCVLDAACASSLAAVKMAVQELQLGTTDMVISGGSDALNDIFMYMCFSKTTALSPSEDCRPFSDKGDGTVLGEAVAMMALKRLEDAERDGDKIYAVITSVGSSSDGKSGSIYAPDSNGQSLAINRAYDAAGFSPQEIELVECHGTGTMAGDYAEFRGLKLAYGETNKKQYCAMGSVKSMIGHTKSAAGAASVLKVAMSLNNKVLPPSIKIDHPNPKLTIEDSPFYLNTKARPWIHEASSSRKAGVSSMGFGGTNFHVAMEEYDNAAARPKKIYVQGTELFLFSGKNSSEITSKLTSFSKQSGDLNIAEKAKLSQGEFVPTDNSRLAILCADEEELTKWINFVLKELEKKQISITVNNSVYYSEEKPTNKVAFLFSGQGSQYVNMGADLLMQYDEAMDPWNHVSEMSLDINKRLNNVVYPIPAFSEEEKQAQKQQLVDTKWAQPAIGVLAISHLNLLSKLNIEPTLLGGHSYGEVAALYAAGIITNEQDLVNISRKRGELMGTASKEEGAMTAVFDSELVVSEKLKAAKTSVVIANINSPLQTVVTGKKSEIEKFEKTLESGNIRFQRLNVSTAFHSELVAGSAKEFEKYLKTIKFGKQKFSVYSNTTAKQYSNSPTEYAKVLANQLAAPVQFEKQVKAMFDEGVNVFLEVGPGKVLGNFVKDILKDKPHRSISMDGGVKQNGKDAFWISLAQLSVSGIPVSYNDIWENVDVNGKVVSAKKPSIATVKINGSNYGKPYPPVGGYESLPKPNKEPVESSKPELPRSQPLHLKEETIQKPVREIELPKSKQAALPINNTISTTPNHQKRYMNEFSDQKLRAFQEIQKNTLEAQKRFQETLAESHRVFLETSQTAFQILGGFNSNEGNIAKSASSFQSMPKTYNSNHAPVNGSSFEKQHAPQVERKVSTPSPEVKPVAVAENGISKPIPKETAYAPVADARPVVEKQPTSLPKQIDFEEVMLQIVADKTGYPKEILDLSTDLESGLGIDSIKRVEILSALQEEFPELKNVDKAKLAAMNTLGEILNYSNSSSAPSPSPVSSTPPNPVNSEVSSGIESVDTSDFKNVMFDIVAEKTGYPKEILDLDTDLESGLGIDSIKRVEILSALQEVFPELKNVDKAKLAAMNTLGEILNYSSSEAPAAQSNETFASNGVDSVKTEDFQNVMFDIVAEKTGYPKEILDLDTDLESGLGIDSIKRVEILSALQEVFPELKNVDKAKLAAMNTLGEILNYSDGTSAIDLGGVSELLEKK